MIKATHIEHNMGQDFVIVQDGEWVIGLPVSEPSQSLRPVRCILSGLVRVKSGPLNPPLPSRETVLKMREAANKFLRASVSQH